MSQRCVYTISGVSPTGLTRIVRVIKDSDFNEFICKISDNRKRRESLDYSTSSKQDAIDIAIAMVRGV